MAEKLDAIIIGAGVIGCCTAFELTKRGFKTLSLDKLPAAGYGSTSNSDAIIRTHYSTFTGTAMAYDAMFIWRKWGEYLETIENGAIAEFREVGCLALKSESNNDLTAQCKHSRALGIPIEDWTNEQIRARYPFIDLNSYGPAKQPDHPDFAVPTGGEVNGAVFFPYAGYVNDPQLAAQNAQQAAKAKGAKFRFNTEVIEIRQEKGRVIGVTLINGDEIDAPVVVNVGGPGSMKICAMAGIAEDMAITSRALRQEVAYIPSIPDIDFATQGLILTDDDVGCYAKPEVGGKIATGGLNPECDPLNYVDSDDFDSNLTNQAKNQIYRIAQRLPSLGIPEHIGGVAACYDQTPDWIPVYDKTQLDGFYLAMGTSGNQFKNAPVAGGVVAALIEACENGRDHDKNPVIYQLKNIDKDIDLSFFSRNRKINTESSFSVMG